MDYREIRNIGQLRRARAELKGAVESRRRALELSWEYLKESWKPDNLVRLAFRGVTFDFSETIIGLCSHLKDYISRKLDEKKSELSEKFSGKTAAQESSSADGTENAVLDEAVDNVVSEDQTVDSEADGDDAGE